jgi:glycosyltransferase involved in cell wall biosynthesis
VRVVHAHRIRGIGGSERHLLTLLPALATRGPEVFFVGLDDPAGAPDPFYAELESAGVSFERLPSPRDADPVLAVCLPRALRRAHPDLVHTHLVHADVYGAIAPGARLVSTKHNPDPFRAGRFRLVERAITRRSARVIAISEALRRFCIEQVGLPEAKVDVVPYGLDALPRPWADNPPLPSPESARVLLCVSRLAPQKGVDTAIRALQIVRRSHPDAVLLVLGEGPERAALETLAAELDLADAVAMPGRVGDVATLYRQCELLVHPARWEGFGLAMLEAMLAAKPVVASRAGSAPDLVEDGRSGALVPVDDAGALAEAVVELLSNPERAAVFGMAGLELARSDFSVERMAERTLDVYERALAER